MDQYYGIMQNFIANNHYENLTKALNSAVTSADTFATLKRLNKKDSKYGHGGQLVIKDGCCYASFLQNVGNDGEERDSTTSEVTFAVFSLERALSDDFDADNDVQHYRIGGKGDKFLDYTAKGIFYAQSMCLVGDDIYICVIFEVDDNHCKHMVRTVYHTKENKFDSQVKMKIRYKGEVYDFTNRNIEKIYVDNGNPAFTTDPSATMEVVSRWNEYKGEYYTTFSFSGAPSSGMIVKTKDFETVEFVSIIPDEPMKGCEAISYIFRDKLYIARRKFWSEGYLIFHRYDLVEKVWMESYTIPDASSRPWFFELNNELYLINTLDEFDRKYNNISKVRTRTEAYLGNHAPIDTVATIYNCGNHITTFEYDGKVYFVSTANHDNCICFGELKLAQFSAERVNEKLAFLLGDK